MKYKIFGAACLVLALVFAATAYYYRGQKAEMYTSMNQGTDSVFVRPHSPVLGSPDARVTLVEFMDPACETCASFSTRIKGWMAESPGKIKLVIRYTPLHKGADQVVAMLEASREQGLYWETLSLLLNNQDAWTRHHVVLPDQVWGLLTQTDLDLDRLKKDMADPDIARRIRQDIADAQALGVKKTPGFFVNGRPLEPFGVQNLYRLIQSEIRATY